MPIKYNPTEIYEPDLIDKLLAERNRIKARERVHISNGKYMYEPSPEYKRFISHKVRLPIKKH